MQFIVDIMGRIGGVQLTVEIIGWIGGAAVLVGYVLVSTNRIKAASHAYQWLNLVGAIGLAINTYYYTSYPSMTLNVVWAGIALYAIRNLVRARGEEPE